MRKYQHQPTEAWAQSLGLVLLMPILLIGLVGAIFSVLETGSYILLAMVFAGFGMLVHFVAYFVVGLPIYVFFWEECKNLWTWKIGLPIGGILGSCVICIPFLWVNGGISSSELTTTFLVGGAYGLITAAAAIHSCRKNLK